MTAIHNARVQLTATILNNLAAAFAVAGLVAPAATGQLNSLGHVIVAVAWSGLATALHFFARAILGGLKQ